MSKKVLIIGLGSIGQNHCRHLEALDCEIAFVTSRCDQPERKIFTSAEVAMQEWQPDRVIIANETAKHVDAMKRIASFGQVPILVEKPLAASVSQLPDDERFSHAVVAYNLRFHPLVTRLHELLMESGEKVITLNAYVGQDLRGWNKEREYSETYRSSRAHGGGVLLDLSHEVDLAALFCGSFTRLFCLGGRDPSLETDCENHASLLIQAAGCGNIALHLNSMDKDTRRFLILNTSAHTYYLDFMGGTLAIDGECMEQGRSMAESYRAMLRSFVAGDYLKFCNYTDARMILEWVETARKQLDENDDDL